MTSKKAGKREEIKNLIKDLKTRYQDADLSIFKSNMNVNLNTVVTYKKDNEEHSFLDMY